MPGRLGNDWLGRNLMELFFWALIGGLVGTALMDIIGWMAGRLKITWGG